MQIVHGVQGAHHHQVNVLLLQYRKHFFNGKHHPVRQQPVGCHGNRPQAMEIISLQIANTMKKIDDIAPYERFPTRNVKFPEIREEAGRQKLEPLRHCQVGHLTGNFPDVAHDATGHTVMDNLQADRLGLAGLTRMPQVS